LLMGIVGAERCASTPAVCAAVGSNEWLMNFAHCAQQNLVLMPPCIPSAQWAAGELVKAEDSKVCDMEG
jgi:hypothetical protein